MRVLSYILIVLGVVIVLMMAAFYILSNHSVTQLSLTCVGTWKVGPEGIEGRAETVMAVIEEYRPWIFWGESDGNVRAESRNVPLSIYYGGMRRIGNDPMTMYQFTNRGGGPMVGGYRASFKELTLQFGEAVFDGTC